MAVETTRGGTQTVLEKATGEQLAEITLATVEDVDAAVAAAEDAQPDWAATTYDERAAVLRRAAAALQDRAGEIADLIVRETGSILGKAQYEVGGAQNELHEAAALTSRAIGEILPSHSPTRLSIAEPVDDEEQAVRLVDDTPYGLVNAVVTGDNDRGLRLASRLRSGMVHVNDSTCLDEAHVPFGGLGASGLGGRAGGESNLEEFTERRWVSLQRAESAYAY